MGLAAQQAQEQLRQAQQGLNLSGFQQAGNMYNQAGQLGLSGFGAGLQGLSAAQQAALSQQGYAQQGADTAYQNWVMSNMLPAQAASWEMQMMGMMPLPYSTSSTGTTTGSATQPGPGFGSILGSLLGGFGSLATGLGGTKGLLSAFGGGTGAKGGSYARIMKPHRGLGQVVTMKRRPAMELEPLERAAYRRGGLGNFADA